MPLGGSDRLYVAVELASDTQGNTAFCVQSCDKQSGETCFLSDLTTQPPYVWGTFKDSAGSFLSDNELDVAALGLYTP